MGEQPSATQVRTILERVSRVIEAAPGLDARSVRVRARVSRRTGDDALGLLMRASFLQRQWLDGDWHYTSAVPYRADEQGPKAAFGASHSAQQGGG